MEQAQDSMSAGGNGALRRMRRFMVVGFLLAVALASGCDGADKDEQDASDACTGISCSDNGVCRTTQDGDAFCDCNAGYHAEGLSCLEDGTTDVCEGVDCSGHGVCVVEEGLAICHCDDGFVADGDHCVMQGPCAGVDCSGHGVCEEIDGVPTCNCDVSYHTTTGLDCIESRDIRTNVGPAADDGVSGETPSVRAYYIDPDGDDSNDGLSPQTAWRTLDNLSNKYFSAGEGVLFKRGGYWNTTSHPPFQGERHGTAAAPIVFSAYGEGPRPIIDFMVPQSPVWTDDQSGNGVYTTPLSLYATCRRMYVDGVEVLDAVSYEELISDPKYKYWHDNENGILYIHFNPEGKEIRYSTVDTFLYFGSGSEYIHVNNLDIRGTAYNNLGFPSCDHVEVHHNNLGWASRQGVSITGRNNLVMDNIVDSGRPVFDYSDSSSTAHGPHEGIMCRGINENTVIAYNLVKNWAHDGIVVAGQRESESYASNVKIHHNYVDGSNLLYGTRLDIQDYTDGVEIYDNYVYKTVRNQISGTNHHIHHNVFDSMKNAPAPMKPYNTGQGISIAPYNLETRNIIVENNVMMNCDGTGITVSSGRYAANSGHVIRNNIIYNCGKDPVTYDGNPEGVSILIKVIDEFPYHPTDIRVFNNLIYSVYSDEVMMYGNEQTGTTYSVSDFDNAVIGDNNDGENNIQQDPLFTDESRLILFPDKLSPVIGAATEPLSTQDWDGNTIEAPYDIGIYNVR